MNYQWKYGIIWMLMGLPFKFIWDIIVSMSFGFLWSSGCFGISGGFLGVLSTESVQFYVCIYGLEFLGFLGI